MIILFFLETVILFCILYFLAHFVYGFVITPKLPHDKVIFKKDSFLTNIFYNLPVQLGKDLARYDKDSFNASGMIIFTGKQGFGKTISMVEYASTLKAMYPECKVISNFDLLFADKYFDGWHDLVTYKNGKYGVIAMLDEISLQFHARNYKNFSPDLIQTITQNRKNRRVILGSAQNLSMCDKQIRLQVTEQRKCFCLFGVLNFVICSIPQFDAEGNLQSSRFKRIYYFVQNDFLREMYDTYSAVEKMSEYGFLNDLGGADI